MSRPCGSLVKLMDCRARRELVEESLDGMTHATRALREFTAIFVDARSLTRFID
ncbi:hypothetical protein F2Q70_00024203 [Brassica cretica]|uniref:Uncharacterized protein n=1 Tax=Brassica cretica TaxID=69181 RepID=A0A8S9LAM0_BRACR|nr:hypothetical protein F2Q70_00024203 [Brassica cretica]KAF3575877.1 hypothetical protein DY000_02028255 [Brassica cretica]